MFLALYREMFFFSILIHALTYRSELIYLWAFSVFREVAFQQTAQRMCFLLH